MTWGNWLSFLGNSVVVVLNFLTMWRIRRAYKLPLDKTEVFTWVWATIVAIMGLVICKVYPSIFNLVGCFLCAFTIVGMLITKTYLRDSTGSVLTQLLAAWCTWPAYVALTTYLLVHADKLDEIDATVDE